MTFFNKKEEVIEVQLTRRGREKLAMGKLNPTHYEFLDEDVIYDIQNATSGSSEEQNKIKARIKEKVTLREPTAKQAAIIPTKKKTYKQENRTIESLGTFSPYVNYRPAWRIETEDGTIFSGSTEVGFIPVEIEKQDSANFVGPSYEKIPQLNLVCRYDYNVFTNIDKEDDESAFVSSVDENIYIDMDDVFSNPGDNSVMFFKKDFNDFTITVEEKNTIKGKDDFTLEVFRYDYQTKSGQEVALTTRLYFDETDIRNDSASWFFNISTDAGVDVFKDGFTFTNENIEPTTADDECKDL